MLAARRMDMFEAKNGERVWVRPLAPTDTPHIIDIFNHMGPDSRFFRFHRTIGTLSNTHIRREAERVTQADPASNFGLIAFDEATNTAVGAARCVGTDGQDYEVAISLVDDWQGLGIGSWLFGLLLEVARTRGIEMLIGFVQHENKAAWGMLGHLGYPIRRLNVIDGVTPIEILLNAD